MTGNWNTAFSRGDHALVGYLTGEKDPIFMANSGLYIPRTQVDTGWNNKGSDTIIPSEKVVWSLVSWVNNFNIPYFTWERFINSNLKYLAWGTEFTWGLYKDTIKVIDFYDGGSLWFPSDICIGGYACFEHWWTMEWNTIVWSVSNYQSTGQRTTALWYAAFSESNWNNNTAIWYHAGHKLIWPANTLVGDFAWAYYVWGENTFIWTLAWGWWVGSAWGWGFNSSVGWYSLYSVKWQYNTAIWYWAGRQTSGDNNIYIWPYTSTIRGNNNIIIGRFSSDHFNLPTFSSRLMIHNSWHTLISWDFNTKEVTISDRLILSWGWSFIVSWDKLSIQYFTGWVWVEKQSFNP